MQLAAAAAVLVSAIQANKNKTSHFGNFFRVHLSFKEFPHLYSRAVSVRLSYTQPKVGGRSTFLYAPSLRIQIGEIVLTHCNSLLGSKPIPMRSLGVVLRNALSPFDTCCQGCSEPCPVPARRLKDTSARLRYRPLPRRSPHRTFRRDCIDRLRVPARQPAGTNAKPNRRPVRRPLP